MNTFRPYYLTNSNNVSFRFVKQLGIVVSAVLLLISCKKDATDFSNKTLNVDASISELAPSSVLYIATGSDITTKNLPNPLTAWRYQYTQGVIVSPLAIQGSGGYFAGKPTADSNYYLYKLDLNTRNIIWHTSLGEAPAGKMFTFNSLLIGDGKIYVPFFNQKNVGTRETLSYIVALDTSSGIKHWQRVDTLFGRDQSTAPIFLNSQLIYGVGRRLTCINSENGSTVWQRKVPGAKYAILPPCFNRTNILTGTINEYENNVAAFRSSNGSLIYATPYTDSFVLSFSGPYPTPTIIRNRLIVNGSTNLLAFDIFTGSKVWEHPGRYTAATNIDSAVFVSTYLADISLSVIDGSINWSSEKDFSRDWPNPVAIPGYLFTGREDYTDYRAPKTGANLASYRGFDITTNLVIQTGEGVTRYSAESGMQQ